MIFVLTLKDGDKKKVSWKKKLKARVWYEEDARALVSLLVLKLRLESGRKRNGSSFLLFFFVGIAFYS